jgi:hypothetical protein
MDACPKANEVLHKKLNEAIDAIEKGDAPSFDKALEDMIKTRKAMELGACPIIPRKEMGFKKD